MGSHTVEVSKADYTPYTITVTITDGQTTNLYPALGYVYTDSDVMPDVVEKKGWIDQYGNRRYSDPYNPDSDNDGNPDDIEAGIAFINQYGQSYWKITGDALKTDTDGDGASDYVEMTVLGTDPMVGATVIAPEILMHQSSILHSDAIHLKTYTNMGGAFGETGIKDGTMNWLVGDNVASSFPYFAGWMASGYFVVGDVRDLGETIYQGDGVGTALNALAFAPALGDGGKSVKNVRKVIVTYPAKAAEMGTFISKQMLPYVPDDLVKLDIWDWCYNGAGRRLVTGQVTAEHVLDIAKRDVDLSKVEHVVPLNSGKAIPVQEGKHTTIEKFGRIHYEGRHVTGIYDVGEPGTTLFPATTQVVWNIGGTSVTYPGKSLATPAEIKAAIPDWIDRAIISKGWTEWPKQATPVKLTLSQAEVDKYGVRVIEVAINGKTGVASIYPTSGPQVYKWHSGKWNAMP